LLFFHLCSGLKLVSHLGQISSTLDSILYFLEQTYLQSTTTRLEEMRVKRRDAEQWMSHRLLPDSLRERIRRHEQYKWQETRGVDEDNLIRDLPKDLRRDIKRHLCLALLMRVSLSISWFSFHIMLLVFFYSDCDICFFIENEKLLGLF